RLATAIPTRLIDGPPVAPSELPLSVKLAFLARITVSLPPPPVRLPVPFQPVTVKLLAFEPPLRLATEIPARLKVGPPVAVKELSVSVKSASLLRTTESIPPPPVRLPPPVQPVT